MLLQLRNNYYTNYIYRKLSWGLSKILKEQNSENNNIFKNRVETMKEITTHYRITT